MITQPDLIALLREQARPSQGEWAKAHGVAASYLSDVLSGRRDPGKSILRAIGYERVVMYRKVASNEPPARG